MIITLNIKSKAHMPHYLRQNILNDVVFSETLKFL